MVTITERAAAKVKEIADAENLHGQGLRLRVIGGGCSGFSYDLYFEDSPTDMDEEFEARGVKLYVDPLSFQYLEGTEIDYVEELHASGFKFNNPKASGTCGCGSSFSALDPEVRPRRSAPQRRRRTPLQLATDSFRWTPVITAWRAMPEAQRSKIRGWRAHGRDMAGPARQPSRAVPVEQQAMLDAWRDVPEAWRHRS